MRRLKVLVLAALLGLEACQREAVYTLSGSWEGGDGQVVRLVDAWGEQPGRVIDSTVVEAGKYVLTVPLAQPGRRVLAELGSKYKFAAFLDEDPMVANVVRGDNDTLYRLEMHGGKEQEVLEKSGELLVLFGFTMMFGGDPTQPDKMLEAFIDSNRNSQATAYFMADLLAAKYSLPSIKADYARLAPEVQASPAGHLLWERMALLDSISTGGIAPDIQLPDTTGQTLCLYALRGKYVLLDFWASWCGPCREEIPNLKAIYADYRAQGLEIFSVSLDDKREAWTKAIRDLELPWLHVSSLQGWDCPVAKRYAVTGIPRMFLLDPKGKVIAMDLRGEELKEKIASLLNVNR